MPDELICTTSHVTSRSLDCGLHQIGLNPRKPLCRKKRVADGHWHHQIVYTFEPHRQDDHGILLDLKLLNGKIMKDSAELVSPFRIMR